MSKSVRWLLNLEPGLASKIEKLRIQRGYLSNQELIRTALREYVERIEEGREYE
jgi:metal-responsive CopG/Arc/MetJ family transcriptional regulator